MDPEEIVPLKPINFFQLALDCYRLPSESKKGEGFRLTEKNFDKYKLPSTAFLTGDDSFAEVALGWDTEGLEAFVKVDAPFVQASYPQVTAGDSVELFIDTRDIKTSGYNTRFCHHFFFLPEALEGRQAGELTRFRSEDAHELCSPNDLKVKGLLKKNNYSLQIFIPSSCLQGYDPEQYGRLGFNYRINHGGGSQHFSAVTSEYQIEQQPSLWSSLKLIK
jgi:hypothetical protein